MFFVGLVLQHPDTFSRWVQSGIDKHPAQITSNRRVGIAVDMSWRWEVLFPQGHITRQCALTRLISFEYHPVDTLEYNAIVH
jgi:hypothetical protein